MSKFLEYLQEAEKIIQTVDHMIYITFPLIKDKRLLIKILNETKIAITNCINAILQYEYIQDTIILHKNARENFQIFVHDCAPRYGITKEEINSILELFDIVEKYKESPMNFIKDEKVIILSDSMKTRIITIEEIKSFLYTAKNILKKTKQAFLR